MIGRCDRRLLDRGSLFVSFVPFCRSLPADSLETSLTPRFSGVWSGESGSNRFTGLHRLLSGSPLLRQDKSRRHGAKLRQQSWASAAHRCHFRATIVARKWHPLVVVGALRQPRAHSADGTAGRALRTLRVRSAVAQRAATGCRVQGFVTESLSASKSGPVSTPRPPRGRPVRSSRLFLLGLAGLWNIMVKTGSGV
jgi:hypothetical protein